MRSIEAAAIAGLLHGALSIAGSALLLRAPDPGEGDATVAAWYLDEANQRSMILGVNLLTVSSIMFVWFVAVIRRRVGDRENRFFGTVFLGSALLVAGAWLTAGVLYAAPAVATFIDRRWSALRGEAFHALLIAGSAAGIAAVFKAPAAGAIFAMEVPFRGRFAGERVLPAIFGAAAGYLTMALVDGVESEIEVPLIELTVGRAFLSAVLGLAVGITAIGVIKLINTAEHVTSRFPAAVRAGTAGTVLVGMYALGRAMTGESLALTSGNSVIDWAVKPDHAVLVLLGVFALRAVGPAVSIAGGGVGGLFIPLMAAGAVVGRLFADASSTDDVAFYVIVGAATMLGAGYAVPLTGVVFVAEYTGQAAIIVPALIAMAVSRLVVNNRSVSPAQRS